MKKKLEGKTIYFIDENDQEIMFIDYSTDECIWHFSSADVITITKDMELYDFLNNFMENSYVFSDDILQNYKDQNNLIWYSDCYYDPNNEWSIAGVSCLHIEKKNSNFNIWCTKKLDEKINRRHKFYGISFSPCGNGKYSKNINTGTTLQDDFVVEVYQKLLTPNKTLKKHH